jgi:hypothetical protein
MAEVKGHYSFAGITITISQEYPDQKRPNLVAMLILSQLQYDIISLFNGSGFV